LKDLEDISVDGWIFEDYEVRGADLFKKLGIVLSV
jgi:hypothetical protein